MEQDMSDFPFTVTYDLAGLIADAKQKVDKKWPGLKFSIDAELIDDGGPRLKVVFHPEKPEVLH
jgi:hypothetical protein